MWKQSPPTGSHLSSIANKSIATNPKKNSGIETPAIPATVSELSVPDPLLRALITPSEQPIIVENNKSNYR